MNRLTKRSLKDTSTTLQILWLIIHTTFLYIAYTICFDDLVLWADDIFEIDFNKGNIFRNGFASFSGTTECGTSLGDVNGDITINILDLVQIANYILDN